MASSEKGKGKQVVKVEELLSDFSDDESYKSPSSISEESCSTDEFEESTEEFDEKEADRILEIQELIQEAHENGQEAIILNGKRKRTVPFTKENAQGSSKKLMRSE